MSSTGTSTATDELRRPFLIIAIVLMAVVVLLEIGSAGILKRLPVTRDEMETIALQEATRDGDDDFDVGDVPDAVDDMMELAEDDRPPGLAIPYMAMLDVLLLVALGLMGLGLVIPERIQGRAQGIVDLILAIVLIIGSIVFIIIAFVLLLVMIALLTAAPWGTIAYFAIYAFFDRTGAAIVLGILMALKIGTCISLVLAQQRFLQAKSLLLMMATSLVAMLIVGFLHNIVPLFLVSITDAIAAIIIAILALIWAIVLLIMAIVSIVKLIL